MSMVAPVLWVSRHPDILARGYADQGLLEEILSRRTWTPPDAISFHHQEMRDDLDEPIPDGAVVVLPARHHVSDVDWFLDQLDRLRWSVIILSGDEEWSFPWRRVEETNRRRVWVMQPRPEHEGLSYLIPGGWYPGTRDLLRRCRDLALATRGYDWMFMGQVTDANPRREEFARIVRDVPGGFLRATPGYLQGVAPQVYFQIMADSKVVACPSGPMTVDTARTLEALEAGCVPVSDLISGRGEVYDYWTLLFGEGHPLRSVSDWAGFRSVLREILEGGWVEESNRTFAFWQGWKRNTSLALDRHVREASGSQIIGEWSPDDVITVVIPSSPTPSDPDGDHLARTIDSIRANLPLAEIIVTFDGVRPEQEAMKASYQEAVRRSLWEFNHERRNVLPLVMDEWSHQAEMARLALERVETPLVLYVEHDTPLEGDIPWEDLCDFITSGRGNLVRFSHETTVLDAHAHLHGPVETHGDLPLRRSLVWWQRPHLASSGFYRNVLASFFSAGSRTMIEDRMHSVVEGTISDRGEEGWERFRLWLYSPPGSIKRSGHLDARGDQPKFSDTFSW